MAIRCPTAAHRRGRRLEPVIARGEDEHRGTQRLPALQREGHHEPPLVTVPLALLPVVGAWAGCRLVLLLVELESVVVVVEVVVLAVAAEDLPAYEAAAT